MNLRRSALPFFEHPLSVFVDASSVVAILTREQYADSAKLEIALDQLQARLRDGGVDETRISAVADIVGEFTLNSHLHGAKVPADHECVLVCLSEDELSVVMLGEGPEHDVGRIERALKAIRSQVHPHDRRKLFAMRNDQAWRNRHSPLKVGGGAGLGMLTISALARDHLQFRRAPRNGETAFFVKSSV